MLSEEQYSNLLKKKEDILNCIELFKTYKVSPTKNLNEALANINSALLNTSYAFILFAL